uniref:Aminotransferase-like plant mobile domain-containing protein n=1 Tax=Fagus sylvatica TaxID=28930 RepID=A0A2N9GLN2_FAGSY
MVVFVDSSKTPKNQFITILSHADEPIEEGITLAVLPSASFIYSSSPIDVSQTPHLSQWWSESSRELYDPSKRDSHPVQSKIFTLRSSLHSGVNYTGLFPLLARRINVGEAHWATSSRAPPLQYTGEFSYIPKYWEWLEDILSRNKKTLTDAKIYGAVRASLFTYDRNVHAMQAFFEYWCPATNTLHTSVGEISITLWDLCRIGGLPLFGSFYDEVVPSAKEMSSLPSSCEYLFAAFHHLSLKLGGPDSVTSTEWVGFWFRGSVRYPKPPNRRSLRRSVRGKLSHNPRGIITTHRNQCRTEDEEAPFRILKVSEKAKEETWLAALLSCWLGEFVFPGKEANLIRPGTFKVASSMARGKKYCLAVPVLATIYKGLNDIASSSVPSKCDTTFPAHYLNAWLAEYFATHFDLPEASPLDPCMVRFSGEGAAKYFEEAEARKLFCSITKFKFHRLALFKGHQEILEDNDQLSDSYVDYFISQRPSYLSSRRGDLSVLEPYSPHRFGRQFGFTQDIPGEIKEDLRAAPLERVMHLWHRCLRINTKSQFLVPSRSPSDAAPCTKDYMDWWAKRSDGFFSSDPSQPNGNIGPSKLIVKLKRRHESDEPSEHQEDNKLSLRISEGTDETSGIVSTFRGADRAMASHAKKLNEEDGISCSDHGNEVSRNDSDRHWRRRKYKDNVIDGANHEIVMKTTEPFIDVDTPSPFSGGDEQVGVDSLKEVDKRQSPVDGSPSMSEFSVQGLETFDLATKVIEKPHLEKSNASIPPSGPICNPTKDMVSKVRSSGIPTASTVSTLNAEDVISKASRHYAFMLGEGLIEKIIKTPFDSVASLKEEVRKIIHAIRQTTIVDVMPLQDRVWKFMENASQYSSIRSAFTQRISLEVKNQRRADAERRYTLALESEAIEARDSSRAEAELSKVLSKETELRKELELLATQRGKLENSISLHEEKLPQLQAAVSRIKEEISEIEATPTLETSDHAKLQELRELLETSRKELKNLDWIGRSSFM